LLRNTPSRTPYKGPFPHPVGASHRVAPEYTFLSFLRALSFVLHRVRLPHEVGSCKKIFPGANLAFFPYVLRTLSPKGITFYTSPLNHI
jgi:hypothetical protein